MGRRRHWLTNGISNHGYESPRAASLLQYASSNIIARKQQ
jgi:hypothetical protein